MVRFFQLAKQCAPLRNLRFPRPSACINYIVLPGPAIPSATAGVGIRFLSSERQRTSPGRALKRGPTVAGCTEGTRARKFNTAALKGLAAAVQLRPGHHNSKGLASFHRFSLAQNRSQYALRQQVNLAPEQHFQELALSFDSWSACSFDARFWCRGSTRGHTKGFVMWESGSRSKFGSNILENLRPEMKLISSDQHSRRWNSCNSKPS